MESQPGARRSPATPPLEAGAFVLAGGESRRMGRDKARLKLAGEPLLARALRTLRPYFSCLAVVVREPAGYAELGVPVLVDRFPGLGPQAGLEAALAWSPHERNVVLACDLPLVPAQLAVWLVEQLEPGWDAVVPAPGGAVQPLCAAYRRSCLPVLRENLRARRLALRELLSRTRVRYAGDDELRPLCGDLARAFCNVNSPADLRQAAEWLRRPRSQ